MTTIERRPTIARPSSRRSRVARRVVAVLLVLAAITWLPLNHGVEGPTLFVLDATHGITEADLLSVAVFLVARVLFLSTVRP